MAVRKIKCLDGLEIDPETCPIEELERVQKLCKREEDYWNTMQLSAKTFINSVYGVFGTNFFNLANIDIAESITLQGQDLIKYSVKQVNGYFKELWHNDFEGHKRVSDIMINEYGFKDFDRENFERLAKEPLQFNSLQIYGDSVVGDSLILTDSGEMRIEDMFNECCYSDSSDKIRAIGSKRKVYTMGDEYPVLRDIAYIMRHKTNKMIYRVVSESGRFVDATEDHSIIVCRGGKIIEICPTNINIDSDKLIVAEKTLSLGYIFEKIASVDCSPYNGTDNFVYDIAVVSDCDDEHTFFANGICVHNTDSVSGDTIIRTQKHPGGIKISEFYEENIENIGECTKAGHESVNTDDKVLNALDGCVYSAGVKRIIRHKVTKPKWKLTTSSGKTVYCTPDHSLVVVRNNKEVVIKPNEIQKGDKVITIK